MPLPLTRAGEEVLATSPLEPLAATWSTPAITPEVEPLPLELSTLTGTTVAPAATPITPMSLSMAAMVPATWLPWPLPSSGDASLPRVKALNMGHDKDHDISATPMTLYSMPCIIRLIIGVSRKIKKPAPTGKMTSMR